LSYGGLNCEEETIKPLHAPAIANLAR